MAVNDKLSLIQGFPGTGKTTTSAAIIYSISKNIKKELGKSAPIELKKKRNILVCAPSNVAVDNVVKFYSEHMVDNSSNHANRFSFDRLLENRQSYNIVKRMKTAMDEKRRKGAKWNTLNTTVH